MSEVAEPLGREGSRQEPACPGLQNQRRTRGNLGPPWHTDSHPLHASLPLICHLLSQEDEYLPQPMRRQGLKTLGLSELAALLCYPFLTVVCPFLISWGVGQTETGEPRVGDP